MTTNPKKDLLLAILAMDSYNRDYGAGIAGLGGIGSTIGSATLSTDSTQTLGIDPTKATGFYASAYTWGNDTVISYRGTDHNIVSPWGSEGSDMWNGYGSAIGYGNSAQAKQAAQFFKAVSHTTTGDPSTAAITLTGHSLGGGLAGLIGSIYGQQSWLFDNMPFELSAQALSTIAQVQYALGFSTALQADFYNNTSPPNTQIGSNLHAFATTGEFLAALRGLQSTPVTYYDSNGGLRSPFTLHSISLLTNLMFADLKGFTNWISAGPELWNGYGDSAFN